MEIKCSMLPYQTFKNFPTEVTLFSLVIWRVHWQGGFLFNFWIGRNESLESLSCLWGELSHNQMKGKAAGYFSKTLQNVWLHDDICNNNPCKFSGHY